MSRPASVRKEIQNEGLEFSAIARYIDKLEAEIERLKGIKPDLPPYPSEPYGSDEWPRFGLRWNGPDKPLTVQMNDGYWTPYHIAKASADQRVIDAVASARKSWAAQAAHRCSKAE